MMADRETVRWYGAIAASTVLSAGLAWAGCPPNYQNEFVWPYFSAATTTLQAAVGTVDAALSAQLETNSQRLMSAVAVLTKQKALAASQVSEATKTTAQTTAVALKTMGDTQRVKLARLNFGGEYGQGYAPCTVAQNRQNLAAADAERPGERRYRVMSEIEAAPGRYADPEATRAKLMQARTDFCTADQAASGLCHSTGRLPGADLSVGALYQEAMEGEDAYRAKNSFVNLIAGLPDAPLPTRIATTPAAGAYMLSKTRKDALISPALTSFKEIQLDYSGVDSAHGASGLPIATQFRQEVARYAGDSSEYDSWVRVMAGQTERGALVELLKIKALDLAIQEREYRQYERMEATLASLVSMAVDEHLGPKARAAARAAAVSGARKDVH